MTWPASLKLNRKQAAAMLAYTAAATGTAAGLIASGTLHPRVPGWALIAQIPVAAVALAAPGFIAAWSDYQALQARPDCRACGRKMIPADVRFSWFSRLRYHRCECGRSS